MSSVDTFVTVKLRERNIDSGINGCFTRAK